MTAEEVVDVLTSLPLSPVAHAIKHIDLRWHIMEKDKKVREIKQILTNYFLYHLEPELIEDITIDMNRYFKRRVSQYTQQELIEKSHSLESLLKDFSYYLEELGKDPITFSLE